VHQYDKYLLSHQRMAVQWNIVATDIIIIIITADQLASSSIVHHADHLAGCTLTTLDSEVLSADWFFYIGRRVLEDPSERGTATGRKRKEQEEQRRQTDSDFRTR